MKHLVVFTAFDRTTSDGLSFDLSSTLERQPTTGVVPDFLNWLDLYSQSNLAIYGFTYQKVTGTSQAISLKLSTTAGNIQRVVTSDIIDLLAGTATWTATPSGATFSVSPNFFVAFRTVASKTGTNIVSVLNASDGDRVLDTFNVTVSTDPAPPEFQPEFVSYGTGWDFMSSGSTTSQLVAESLGISQLIGSFVHDDPGTDELANNSPFIFGGNATTGKLYQNYVFDSDKPMLAFRPSSVYGTANRAQEYITANPNSYMKVYYGPANVYGNRYRLFTNPRRLQTASTTFSTDYVMYTASTVFPESQFDSGKPFRIELYNS
jgi:hypothetical protein